MPIMSSYFYLNLNKKFYLNLIQINCKFDSNSQNLKTGNCNIHLKICNSMLQIAVCKVTKKF